MIVVDVDENRAKQIERLYLNRNPVTTIEGAEKLVALTQVYCSGCKLTSVPRWIEKLPAIEEVNLYNNKLEELPSWLLRIKTLKKVIAHRNKNLKNIHFHDPQSSSVETKSCITEERNSEDESKDEIEKSTLCPEISLTFLQLNGCDIQSLPDDLFHHRLEEVSVSGNKSAF